MLTWLRRRAARLGAVVLVSLGAMGVSQLSPHPLDCHGGGCVSAVEHDASAHRIGAAARGAHDHPFHCLACHWSRTFRPPAQATVLPASTVEVDARIPLESHMVAHATLTAQPPLRSPPLSPALA